MVDETLITAAVLPVDTASPPPAENMPEKPSDQTGAMENLQKDLDELKRAFVNFTRQNMPEIEQVREDLLNATAERDNVTRELKRLQRDQQLNELTEQHHFSDVEYLDFLLQKNNIAPDDPVKVNAFLQKFKNANPRYFVLPVKSGAGSRPGSAPETVSNISGNSRMDLLENMLSAAPEIF